MHELQAAGLWIIPIVGSEKPEGVKDGSLKVLGKKQPLLDLDLDYHCSRWEPWQRVAGHHTPLPARLWKKTITAFSCVIYVLDKQTPRIAILIDEKL